MTLTSPDGRTKERTEVYYGEEEAMKILLQAMTNVKKEAVVCSDANSPAFSMGVEPVKRGFNDFKKRGVKIRQIVEITKDNLEYCKEFMNYVELRHMDNVKGNMAISETEYVATAVLEGAAPITQTLYSNVKAFLEQQRYFFENLWSKAIPAGQRIREIEEGRKQEIIEVIDNPYEVQRIYFDLVRSAKTEIMLILPTATAFKREKKMEVIESIVQAAAKGVKVRILMPTENETDDVMQEVQSLKQAHSIDVRATKLSSQTTVRIKVVVVDRIASLIVELQDDSKLTFTEAVGSAVYATSKPKVMSYVTIFDSLWNQSELYEQVRELNKKLEMANEQLRLQDIMQREFINVAAHELRTPIQPILGMADLIQLGFRDGKEKIEITKEEMEIIARNAKRLERLSSDILEIARIEGGGLRLNIQEFNLNNDVILPLVQDARNEINSSKDVKIDYFPSESENIVVKGDKGRIAEVIWNLLNNAIKFTEKGTISINIKKDDNGVTVSVKDSGSGIDIEIQSKLFTKFVTKSDKGTGLGLFISKSIVVAHGGEIWAENNEDGKGANFRFTVPVSK